MYKQMYSFTGWEVRGALARVVKYPALLDDGDLCFS